MRCDAYRERTAMKMVNAAFSKSVSCTSIERNSTRQPMPLLGAGAALAAEEGAAEAEEAEEDAGVAGAGAGAGAAAAAFASFASACEAGENGGGLKRTVCQFVD